MGDNGFAQIGSFRPAPKESVLVRLQKYGNRHGTSWEAAALCVSAHERITELETALNLMVQAHVNLESDTEGQYPSPDAGCIECTAGTVPDRLNTGLCAYHNAGRMLRK